MKPTYKTPESLINDCMSAIEAACKQSSHGFRTAVLSTCFNNEPDSRTVVLRQCHPNRRTLIFHTDIRSPKVEHIKQNSSVSILFYCKEIKRQCRFNAIAHIQYESRLSTACFNTISDYSKQCYQYPFKPGTEITQPSKEQALKSQTLNDPKSNFCAIVCNYYALDALQLHHKEHIRARISWNKTNDPTASFIIA